MRRKELVMLAVANRSICVKKVKSPLHRGESDVGNCQHNQLFLYLFPAFLGTFLSLELKNKETKKSLPNPEPLSFLVCLLNYIYFSHNQEQMNE
ncbi:hypothetical protein QOT17_005499 [Balamuthia mandrillaris]